jgi:sporulation protein YlmC with PRC-barrel domain
MGHPFDFPRTDAMKKSTLAASAALLMMSTAIASAQTTAPQPGAPPASQQPAPVIVTPNPTTPPMVTTTPPATTAQPSMTTTTTTTAQSGGMWYTAQSSDMRASKLIGTNVKNQAGETIGEINEIILSPDGRVHAVVVGVGGFLGIGEREVAMDFNQLKLAQDNSNRVVATTTVNKQTLEQAPRWTWRDTGAATGTTTGTGARSTTTGTGTGSTTTTTTPSR